MQVSPFFGVLLLALGGLAGGSFYVPFSKVKTWAWETYWLTMGVIAWVLLPVVVAWLTTPHLLDVLSSSPVRSLVLAYLFGAMWGVGAVTFGLTMRYLGISLGMAVIIGLCAAFATLIPPLVDGQFGQLLTTASGLTVLSGVAICLGGIGICGCAGTRKEHELSSDQKQESVKEFALGKGFIMATISGATSAGLIFGINAGRPIAQIAMDLGTAQVYQNNAVFIIVMAGGFTVNSLFCLILNLRNRSIGQYVRGPGLLANYSFVALAAILWYSQVFFYGMGRAKMGYYDFAAWSIQTALIIVFSTIWGLGLKEWKGVSKRTLRLVWIGIAVLVLSAMVIGAGSYLGIQ